MSNKTVSVNGFC